MTADDLDTRPRCAVETCGAVIWWNPRRRAWSHYFEDGDHEATILVGAAS